MEDRFFRYLTPREVEEFREYARKNDPPRLDSWYAYHPICREEWEKRGIHPPQDVIDHEMMMRVKGWLDSLACDQILEEESDDERQV